MSGSTYEAAVAEVRQLLGHRPIWRWAGQQERRAAKAERDAIGAEVQRERLEALDQVIGAKSIAVVQLLARRYPLGRFPRLAVAGALCRMLERVLVAEVGAARDSGADWAEVGRALGMSRQGARQRFG
jgi:hypothetical protein